MRLSTRMACFLLGTATMVLPPGFVSCSKSKSPADPVTVLTVESPTLPVSNEAGPAYVTFKCNKNWQATSSEEWLAVTPTEGTGSARDDIRLTLTYEANPGAGRSSVITIKTVAGDRMETITVSQASVDDSITIDPETLNFDKEGHAETPSFTIVKSTGDWEINLPEGIDWVTFEPASGNAGENIEVSVAVDPTELTVERDVIATLTTGTAGAQLRIVQAAGDTITIDPATLTFDKDGNAETSFFTITKSTSDWEISLPEEIDWITFNPASGPAGENIQVTLTVDPTDLTTERKAIATVAAGGAAAQLEIIQLAIDLAISHESIEFPANGELEVPLTITSADDFTINYDAGWLTRIADDPKTAPALTVTAKNGEPVTVKFKASANISWTNQERTANIIISRAGKDDVLIPVKQSGEVFLTGSKGFPVTWLLSAAEMAKGYKQTFENQGYLQAVNGSAATISFVRGADNQQKKQLLYEVGSTGHPLVVTGLKDDYYLFDLPVDNLPAKSVIHAYLSMRSSATGPGYVLFEYLDNGQWKRAGDPVQVIPGSLGGSEYHYWIFDPSKSSSANTRLYGELEFENAVSGSVQIRIRVADNVRGGGAAVVTDPTATGTMRIAGNENGLNPYFRYLGTDLPANPDRVLFIGNSYTYYYNLPFYFGEIAWSQGQKIHVEMSGFSGYTFKQHNEESRTQAVIAKGGYKYAVVQDQSLQSADIKNNPNHDHVLQMGNLLQSIHATSTGVQPVMYGTWGRKDGYGGMTFEEHTDALFEGFHFQSQTHSAWLSPVGIAWKQVRSERPDIELYDPDKSHPVPVGTYLAACVIYQTIYNTPFTASVSDCDIDPATAAYLRGVAENVVIGHDAEYHIQR